MAEAKRITSKPVTLAVKGSLLRSSLRIPMPAGTKPPANSSSNKQAAELSEISEEKQPSVLSVEEAAELSKMLEEKWDVSTAAPVAAASAGSAPVAGTPVKNQKA